MEVFRCVSLITLLLVVRSSNCMSCNEFCRCSNNTVMCTGRSLSYIPKVPNNTVVLEMNRTGLQFLKRNAFDNISTNSLKKISFIENKLQSIDPEAFIRFKLKTLRIMYEPQFPVDDVMTMFTYLETKDLKYLYLSFNQWKELPPRMFQSFRKSKSKLILNLEGNKFKYIKSSVFSPLLNLMELYLRNNTINQIDMVGLHENLKRLDLRNNGIVKVPNWCKDKKQKVSSVPNLVELQLEDNFISDIGPGVFTCLPKLQHLNLNHNRIGKLTNNAFTSMLSLQTLQIMMVGQPLKEIKTFAFNSTSLQSVKMDKNNFRFEKGWYDQEQIFAHCPNLIDLSLSHNYMFNGKIKVENMLLPLKNLKYLDLSSTNVITIPLLDSFANLERYNLDGNHIMELNGHNLDFKNLKSLKTLVLSNNNIQVFNETSIPSIILRNLKTLDLSGNPFACNCDLLWFTKWIKTTKTRLPRYPWYYRCHQPKSLKNVPLSKYVKASKTCPPWNPLYTLAIALSLSSLIFVSIMVIFGKCMNNLRNFIYLIRLRRKGYLPLLASCDFEYDAFVVYCEKDREWVHTSFVKRIEDQGFKVCIHHRDFDAGEAISDNFINYLERSKKVVVIMSNDFTKSEWCQWETDVVLKRLRTCGPDILVLVMLKPIDSKHMTSKLRSILQLVPCLYFKAGIGEDMFWKTVVKALNKPIGHPPVALP